MTGRDRDRDHRGVRDFPPGPGRYGRGRDEDLDRGGRGSYYGDLDRERERERDRDRDRERDRDRYLPDKDRRETMKLKGIDARAREAELYKSRVFGTVDRGSL